MAGFTTYNRLSSLLPRVALVQVVDRGPDRTRLHFDYHQVVASDQFPVG